ncbi:hypothetical protein [Neobacillus jeddahensis]|uniref:hypothetical protein n=1 Tax=Neobacillus jeddahensis TaxID=1461580 RepID=UPI0005A989BC|nr:hypothetical protein [Neobacillus jeddahensis]
MFVEGKTYWFKNAHDKAISVKINEVYVDVFEATVTCENAEHPYEEFIGHSEECGFEKALRKAIRKCNGKSTKGFHILRRQIKLEA